jgi:hypothetical protein
MPRGFIAMEEGPVNRPFVCPVIESPSDSLSGHFGRITSRADIEEGG